MRAEAGRRIGTVGGSLLATAIGAAAAAPAWAHSSERAFVLTLPSDLYIVGGALTVAATFAILALLPAGPLRGLEGMGLRLGRFPAGAATAASLVASLVMAALILAGRFGTQDPLMNPLSLSVWTLWWIGLTLAHAVFGDLWAGLNPWLWIFRLTVFGRLGARPPLRYPDWLGVWPAILQLLGFAWFELVYTAPQSPAILAEAVAAYFVLNLLLALLFGPDGWLRRGEAFAVFFRMVAWLSPLNGRPHEDRPVLALPGVGLLNLRPLSASGIAFVLLALSSVSFEGLAITYWWAELIGVNPLEFPGRSAVMEPNTFGLVAVYLVWLACYLLAAWAGHALAGRPGLLRHCFGSYVVSLVPIALAYHFAHYLTSFLVDIQYAAIVWSDPLRLGWDTFGAARIQVTTSFLNDYESVRLIWHSQVGAIVLGHVMAVCVAHAIALRQAASAGLPARSAVVGQLPMTLLMVGYTLFGLWLLSTPAIG